MVPADNFYRRLSTELDLHFIYKATQKYYGKEGQESIDPVVFFQDFTGWIFKQYQ
ncbi:hypothetical protein ACLH3R_002340 [Flavobacterium psychrophilum]